MLAMDLPATGDLLNGRYRLEALLGQGGFGSVFRAVDLETRGIVAVKVLHPDNEHGYLAATQRRFEREVAVLVQLQNVHTVQLLAYGSTASRLFYLVFEYLEGRDLSEMLDEGPLPAPVAEHILRQLLASLAEAHRAGLTHRDIKPANVRVLDHDGDPFFVKLLDFGIARSTDRDRMAVTRTGEIIGTPRYMSPEQLRTAEITTASDVYSLGMLTVEMLLGPDALPANGFGAQLERLQSGYLLPAVPNSRLHHVIQRMTASKPQDRYPTAAQALLALDGEPPATATATVAPKSTESRKLVAVAVVAVALVIAVGALLLETTREPEPLPLQPNRSLGALIASVDAGSAPVDVPDAAAADAANSADAADAPKDATPDIPSCYKLGFTKIGRLAAGKYEPAVVYHPSDIGGGGLPLVVFLHGKFDEPSSDRMGKYLLDAGLTDLADEKRFAIVAPRDRWAAKEPWEEAEDVEQLQYWVERLVDEACIDPSRVYVVAQSDAAFLHHYLRCESWVTAVASNSSRTIRDDFKACEAAPLPAIWVTPRDSNRMPEDGGTRCSEAAGDIVERFTASRRGPSRTLEDFRATLKRVHGCRGEAMTVHEQDNGSCQRWKCRVPLRLCVHEGGEPWPGTSTLDYCAGQAPDFPVGEQIWEFLESVPPLKPK